ncbi:unnamed protein product [Penicillium bialowiezense]
MSQLRDTLLGPSPQDLEDIQGGDSIAYDREFVRWWIAHGGLDEIRGYALENRTGVATPSHCEAGDSVDSIVGYSTIVLCWTSCASKGGDRSPDSSLLLRDIDNELLLLKQRVARNERVKLEHSEPRSPPPAPRRKVTNPYDLRAKLMFGDLPTLPSEIADDVYSVSDYSLYKHNPCDSQWSLESRCSQDSHSFLSATASPTSTSATGNYGINIARTVEGTVWNDVPFLVTDMTEARMSDFASMSGAQRLNFSSFLAKLASTRVSKNRMCQIAIILFRYIFEDLHEVCAFGEADNQSTDRTLRGLQLQQLLPSVFLWIKKAGDNLLLLSELSWDDCPSTIGHGGSLFVEPESGKQAGHGLSPWRWMFWLKRLHEFQEKAIRVGEKRVEEMCTECISRMLSDLKLRNSEILSAYQSGGEFLRHDIYLASHRTIWNDEEKEEAMFIGEDQEEITES